MAEQIPYGVLQASLTDDLLDEFAIEDMRHKHKNKVKEVFHSLSPNYVAFRRDIAHKIAKIRKDFDNVVQDMRLLNLNQGVVVVKQSESVGGKLVLLCWNQKSLEEKIVKGDHKFVGATT
ncbi:hypothetical protein SESBI_09232 [Sesbania bispinosa]|nr:hypothetical protein SESBI_09232 [Sesbania bispinosa]